MSRPIRVIALAAVLAGGLAAAEPAPPAGAAPDELQTLLDAAQGDPRGTAEDRAMKILDLGMQAARPYAAALTIEAWLAMHSDASPALLAKAGDIAYLAGAFVQAADRYKACLDRMPAGEEASRVAARLYAVLVHALNYSEDAYRFMKTRGQGLRQSAEARRFDGWFLGQAAARNEFDTLIASLGVIAKETADKPALQQVLVLPYVDLLIERLRFADGQPAAIAADLATLVRGTTAGEAYKTHAELVCAHVVYLGRKAKDDKERALYFQPVLKAAEVHLAAAKDKQGALRTVVQIFSRSWEFNDGGWNDSAGDKRSFLLANFQKLPAADQDRFANWLDNNGNRILWRMAGPADWHQRGATHPAFFDSAWIQGALPFAGDKSFKERLALGGGALAASKAPYAVALRSLAAGGDDLAACFEHCLGKEAAALSPDQAWQVVAGVIWPTWRLSKAGGDPKQQPGDEAFFQAIAKIGRQRIAGSLLAMYSQGAVNAYLESLWRTSSPDRRELADGIKALGWVAYDGERFNPDNSTERLKRDVIDRWYGEFKRWEKDVRGAIQRGKAKPDEVAHADAINAAFDRLRDFTTVELATAPNGLCKALAATVMAERARTLPEMLKQAEAVRAEAKAGGAFSRHAQVVLLINRRDTVDSTELAAQVLGDLLTAESEAPGRRAIFATFCAARHEWPWQIPQTQQKQALAVNAVLADLLSRQVAQDKLDGDLFTWFRSTRRGRGWIAQDSGNEVMEAILAKDLLAKVDYRIEWFVVSPAVTAARLVRDEFPRLDRKRPAKTAFDDAFVADAKARKFCDFSYWQVGTDEARKVVNAAAEIFASYDTLPFGYDDRPRYDRGQFNEWTYRILGAADPKAKEAMVAAAEAAYGKRLDDLARGDLRFGPHQNLKDAAQRKDFFVRLGAILPRLAESPTRPVLPAMHALGALKAEELTAEECGLLVQVLRQAAPAGYDGNRAHQQLSLVFSALLAQKRGAEALWLLPEMWRIARDTNDRNFQGGLAAIADNLLKEKQYELAGAIAESGLAICHQKLDDGVKKMLDGLRGRSRSSIGSTKIPVGEKDPRYPAYLSQSLWQTGQRDGAWEAYAKPAVKAQVKTMLGELNPDYLLWVISQSTRLGAYAEAEDLVRAFATMVEERNAGEELKAQLALMRAGIAFERKEYPIARAQYRTIAETKEWANTRAKLQSELGMGDCDRMTRNFSSAHEIFDTIIKRPDPTAQAEGLYHKAQAFHDEGRPAVAGASIDKAKLKEALATLNQLLNAFPDHVEAILLRGKVMIDLQKIGEATFLNVGGAIARSVLEPGRPFMVEVIDSNKNMVKRAKAITLRVWSENSKDEEILTLTLYGDTNDKFRGQLPTTLGPATAKDQIIQVFGGDKVHFDFSEEFKREVAYNGPSQEDVLTVRTNAELLASSGRIPTREEVERQRLQAIINEREGVKEEEAAVISLADNRAFNQVKPGNVVNVRVVDPDRSTTGAPDTLTVTAVAASGDKVVDLALTETAPCSGVFESPLPTAPRPATAFASESATGTNPNAPLSPSATLPAWMAGRSSTTPVKMYGIDLNDYVHAGTMTVLAAGAESAIQQLVVQTSLNGKEFQTVAAYPDAYAPWDGAAQVEMVAWSGALPTTPDAFLQAFDVSWRLRTGARETVAPQSRTLALDWDRDLKPAWDRLAKNAQPEGYLLRARVAFYVEARQTRSFTMEPIFGYGDDAPAAGRGGKRGGTLAGATWQFTIDGKMPPPPPASRDPAEAAKYVPNQITLELGKGVHVMEVVAFANREDPKKAAVRVTWDTDKPPYAEPVPDFLKDEKAKVAIKEQFGQPPVTVAKQGEHDLVLDFAGRGVRIVRFWLLKYAGEAPAIRKVTLADQGGKAVLPTKEDYTVLETNKQLEIVPGDAITITYKDPSVVGETKDLHEAKLFATFTNGSIRAAIEDVAVGGGGRTQSSYIGLRRFEPKEPIKVFVSDPDLDATAGPDTVPVTVETSEKKRISITATETAEHSGVFMGTFFPVPGAPSRDAEIQVGPSDDVVLSYNDAENVDQGIPWLRKAEVEQVVWREPELRVYNVRSEPMSDPRAGSAAPAKPAAKPAAPAKGAAAAPAKGATDSSGYEESVEAVYRLVIERPDTAEDKPAVMVLGGPLVVELLWPTIAKTTKSTATFYAQTTTGRNKAKKAESATGFDITVPGTIRLTTTASAAGAGAAKGGAYGEVVTLGTRVLGAPMDAGMFCVKVPVELGDCPDQSLAAAEATVAREDNVLKVTAGDSIHLGFAFKDASGQERWLTRTVKVVGDGLFDIMDRHYTVPVTGVYVGQSLYLRAIDPLKDTSGEKDRIAVTVTRKDAPSVQIELVETLSHSGIFKGVARIAHEDDKDEQKEINTVPARFGDTLGFSYNPGGGAITREVEVFKGSDGNVLPFTKRFKDQEIAIRTQFSIAEAYFEMAKKHRALARDAEKKGDETEKEKMAQLAREEIRIAKKCLDEALRDFPENEIRAQSDFLLAELELEYANDATNEDVKREGYLKAITMFSNIVANYGDSEYAPRAQFKKALSFHKMGDLERACDEYVKLSYQYPESEYVAETITHLGRYFLTKGSALQKEAADLDVTDKVAAEKKRLDARNLFRTAGSVFGKLRERFPTHNLAAKTTVLAGMCLMQGQEWADAVKTLDLVVNDKQIDDPDLKSEALYWRGDTFLRKIEAAGGRGDVTDAGEAYRTFKLLTWNYPDTKWAKFARGRLLQEPSLLQGARQN